MSYYYKEWIREGKQYRLSMLPSGVASSNNYFELPSECLINVCTVESNYDNDIAIGLPLADVMNIEVDGLRAAKATTIGRNFNEKLNAPMDTDTVNGEVVTIPNMWVLERRTVGAGSYDELLFIGSQDSKPAIDFEVRKNSVKAKIQVISLIRAAMERVSMDMIKPDLNDCGMIGRTQDIWNVQNYDRIIDYAYDDVEVSSKIIDGEIIRIDLLYNLHQSIKNKVDDMVDALSGGAYSFTTTDSLTDWWSFKRANYDDESNNNGDSLDDIDIYYIPYAENTNVETLTTVAGLFDANTKNPTFFEYKNVWDLLKALAENFGQKYYFDNIQSSKSIQMKNYRLLDRTVGEFTSAALTLTANNVKVEFDLLRRGENSVNEVIATYKDIKEEDVEDVSYGKFWTQAEDSYEVESILSNAPLCYSDKDEPKIKDGVNKYIKANINWRGLYCLNSLNGKNVVGKIAGACYYEIGDSKTFTTSTVGRIRPSANTPQLMLNVITETNYRQVYDSMSYPLVRGIAEVYGNDKQGMIKIKTTTNTVSISRIGDAIAFNVNDVTDYDFQFNEPADYANGKNCLIVGVTADYVRNESEVTLFIRGD